MVATQIFFIFIPKIGEDSHFDEYFSDGLVQPPTRNSASLMSRSPVASEKQWCLRHPQIYRIGEKRLVVQTAGGIGTWAEKLALNSFKVMGVEDMGASKNRGTSKSSILIGFSIINHPFWGTTILGSTHMLSVRKLRSLLRMVAWVLFVFEDTELRYNMMW